MKAITPVRLWLTVFGFWGIALTGVFAGFIGSPGAIQAIRLSSLLGAKQQQVSRLQDEVKRLQQEAALLERSRVVQQREIRRVLGYAAPDEIIFDFTTADPL